MTSVGPGPPVTISNYHTDLWEHASELYHLRHWQQSAEIFGFLAKDIKNNRECTKCLVNKALVEARLGDYKQAALTIADAAELGEDLPVTAYIAGLVNCELSQLMLAEAWFEACLTGLENGDLDCSDERLQFILERSAVQHNVDSTSQARLALELGFDDAAPDDLYFIPAELLFEAPSQICQSSPADSTYALGFIDDYVEAGPPEPNIVPESTRASSRAQSSEQKVATASRESLRPLISGVIFDSPDRVSFEEGPASTPKSPEQWKRAHRSIQVYPAPEAELSSPLSRPSSARELRSLERIRHREAVNHAGDGEGAAVPRAKIPYTWHGQQRQRFEPRDARGVSHSVRELAHFVQEFAPEADPVPVRRIGSKRGNAQTALEAEIDAMEDDEALSPRPSLDNVRERGLRAVPGQMQRAVTLPAFHGRYPALNQPAMPVETRGSVLRALRSPATDTTPPRKPVKVRWPFQDDREGLAKPAPVSLPLQAAAKPPPLDFIMGPDGKTIAIEKLPKTAPTIPEALQQIQEARKQAGQTELHSATAPPSSAGDTFDAAMLDHSTDLPLLQPTVYEPPARRRQKQLVQAQPYPPSSPAATFSPPPVPPKDFRNPVLRRKPVADSSTMDMRPGGSPATPSMVSSVNFLDYILDKAKPEEAMKGPERINKRSRWA